MRIVNAWGTNIQAAAIIIMLSWGATAIFAIARYVDPQVMANCTSYSPAERSCNQGSSPAYRDLKTAAAAAQPGDTVFIRQGTYSAQFAPSKSGTATQPIVFINYGSDSVVLAGISGVAIAIAGQSHLTIEGLYITNVTGWVRLDSSNNIHIKNCTFTRATAQGTTGGIKLVRSNHNRITNCRIADGNDNVFFQQSHYNLFEGNTVTKARHTLFNISCSHYNVVRGNTFNNTDQKAVEVFDCEGTVTGQPIILDSTRHNLFEGNIFSGTASSTRDYDYNAMQYAGQYGIVRRNVYYHCLGGGINFQVYDDEALYNHGNRVFHNTFYANACFGLAASGDKDPSRYFDNRAENNLLFRNTDCSGNPVQLSPGNTTATVMTKNAVLTIDPQFVDTARRDFRLRPSSPVIDSAGFLTRTRSAGSGTSLPVEDAGYFYDGFGIAGESGDTIQLAGQTVRAVIKTIDFETKTLTLDRSLTWSSGQGVSLAYAGNAPDMGAFEYSAAQVPPRAKPRNPAFREKFEIRVCGLRVFVSLSGTLPEAVVLFDARGGIVRDLSGEISQMKSSASPVLCATLPRAGIHVVSVRGKRNRCARQFAVLR